jgi:hypothetical protein
MGGNAHFAHSDTTLRSAASSALTWRFPGWAEGVGVDFDRGLEEELVLIATKIAYLA